MSKNDYANEEETIGGNDSNDDNTSNETGGNFVGYSTKLTIANLS